LVSFFGEAKKETPVRRGQAENTQNPALKATKRKTKGHNE
jgi:hypothetical protein